MIREGDEKTRDREGKNMDGNKTGKDTVMTTANDVRGKMTAVEDKTRIDKAIRTEVDGTKRAAKTLWVGDKKTDNQNATNPDGNKKMAGRGTSF